LKNGSLTKEYYPTRKFMIYLDNAATTKPCKACVEAMTEALTLGWGNPSALYHFGVEAARLLRKCRGDVAQALGGETDRVFFTAGGTEGDNWAIFGAAERLGKRGKHIVTTAVEHSAVLNPMRKLEEQGFEVTYLQPDGLGRITVEDLQKALRKDTILVSIMMVNNESGAVMPIASMAKLVHRLCPNALFHTDAVQGFFKVPFRASTLGADMISVSGHKIHGPKGVGALYLRPGLKLPPLLLGGGQENGLRSGTEGLPQIAGFAAACRVNLPCRMEHIAHENALKTRLQEGLSQMEGVHLLGAQEAPHIVNIAVEGVRSQGLLNKLQDHGICVSAGSACSKGHRSHVLEAMGVEPSLIDGSIRISLCHESTQEEVETLLQLLPTMIRELRGSK
jgi:cysteine desulfurase